MKLLPKKYRTFFSRSASSKTESSYSSSIHSLGRSPVLLSKLSASSSKSLNNMKRCQSEETLSSTTENYKELSESLVISRSSYQHEIIEGSPSYFSKSASKAPSCQAPKVSKEVLRELEDAFRFFDSNGDGKISVLELGSVLRSLGENVSEEELKLMIEVADEDGDGYVDLQEFMKLNLPMGSPGRSALGTQEELKGVFYVFDSDKNGYISAEELHHVLRTLGDAMLTVEDCRQMIRRVDSDGDGFVNFEEFSNMMMMSA